jgi:hypothetical protein
MKEGKGREKQGRKPMLSKEPIKQPKADLNPNKNILFHTHHPMRKQ